jgi:hypothetical protein
MIGLFFGPGELSKMSRISREMKTKKGCTIEHIPS